MKIVVAIDSFKGSLTSMQAGNAVKSAIEKLDRGHTVLVKPLADGGEGTVEAFASGPNAETVTLTVKGPLLKSVAAKYCILKDTNTAVIEMASAAGITLISPEERNPLQTTTYGVGELIKDAAERGCRHFIIGIGGSATNDGGAGMLAALGYAFLDKNTPFTLEYGVKGWVTEQKKDFRKGYVFGSILATCLCILSPVPLIASAFLENAMLTASMLGVTLSVAGVGCGIFIIVGVRNGSMQRLLQEGDFTPTAKKNSGLISMLESAYWGIIVVIYLAWSFLGNAWHISWILFLAGGVLSAPFTALCNYLSDKKKQDR